MNEADAETRGLDLARCMVLHLLGEEGDGGLYIVVAHDEATAITRERVKGRPDWMRERERERERVEIQGKRN